MCRISLRLDGGFGECVSTVCDGSEANGTERSHNTLESTMTFPPPSDLGIYSAVDCQSWTLKFCLPSHNVQTTIPLLQIHVA